MSARKRAIFLMTHRNIDLFSRDISFCLPPFSREKKLMSAIISIAKKNR